MNRLQWMLIGAASVLVVGGMIYFGQRGKVGPGASNPPSELRHQVAADGSVSLGIRKYYAVRARTANDTGDKACAAVGKKCLGYTDLSVGSCLAFHPSAATVSDWDGAKPGFYCDGPPESGICAKEINTCHICPQCNTNMECSTVAGTLYRETFVECGDK